MSPLLESFLLGAHRRLQVVCGGMLFAVLANAGQAPLPPAATPTKILVPGVYLHLRGSALKAVYQKNIETYKEICPTLFKKPLQVIGDPSKAGDVSTDVYLEFNRTASYSVSQVAVQRPGDPCSFDIKEDIRVRIARYDGKHTLIWDVDLRENKSRRQEIAGRSPLLMPGEEVKGAPAFVGGTAGAGNDVIAGVSCEQRVQDLGALKVEACVLNSKLLPGYVQGIPLKVTRKNASGDTISEMVVDSFDVAGQVDKGVYELPPGIQ
jgi:hypothetical protein